MGILRKLFAKENEREEEGSRQEFSDEPATTRHVVFALSSAGFKDLEKETPLDTPGIIAASMGVLQASVDDVRLGERGQIYPIDKLRARLSSCSVWLAKDGSAVVTRPSIGEKESDMLKGAKYLGPFPRFIYLTVVCEKLGLDPHNIIIEEEEERPARARFCGPSST